MGERPTLRKKEIAALLLGLDLGLTLIDTAEMYGSGATEEFVGEAVAERRAAVFLVSKVLPSNATRNGTIAACERSLRRLRTDHLDLYLLHWPGDIPLQETLDGFAELVRAGKIRYWGVSNFDVADVEKLVQLPGGKAAATNQVLYNLARRGIEFDLLPWCQERAIPIMAYSPVEQAAGKMLRNSRLKTVADLHNATPAQIAIAWILRQRGICAIPKASDAAHVRENRAALDLRLTERDLAALDEEFRAPRERRPL